MFSKKEFMGKFGKSLGILLAIVLLLVLGACSSDDDVIIALDRLEINAAGGANQLSIGQTLALTAVVVETNADDLGKATVKWSINSLATTAISVTEAKLANETGKTNTLTARAEGKVEVVLESEGRQVKLEIDIVNDADGDGSPTGTDPDDNDPCNPSNIVQACAASFVFATDQASSYARVDRVGMPAIATVVITSKDAYNQADPAGEAANLTFAGEIATNVNGLHTALDDDLATFGLTPCKVDLNDPFNATTSNCITQAAPLVVPDTVTIDTTIAAGFPNGRRLEDPVVDVTLAVILLDLSVQGQSATTLADVPVNPPANDKAFSADFPFLASPH